MRFLSVFLTRITYLKEINASQTLKSTYQNTEDILSAPSAKKTQPQTPPRSHHRTPPAPDYYACDTSQQAAKYSVNFGSLPYVIVTQQNAVLMALLTYPVVSEYWMTQYLSGLIVHFLASFGFCLSKQKCFNFGAYKYKKV